MYLKTLANMAYKLYMCATRPHSSISYFILLPHRFICFISNHKGEEDKPRHSKCLWV